MSDITRKALASSLINLCDTKKLNKITVQDIVNECGVNRNTFYYHFSDVYDLLDYIFKTEEDVFRKTFSTIKNWQQGFENIVSRVSSKKNLILNVYNSINREQLERYFYSIFDELLREYLNTICDTQKLKKDDLALLVNFLKCGMVGLILEWVGNGMNGDIVSLSRKLDKMTDGIALLAYQNLLSNDKC